MKPDVALRKFILRGKVRHAGDRYPRRNIEDEVLCDFKLVRVACNPDYVSYDSALAVEPNAYIGRR